MMMSDHDGAGGDGAVALLPDDVVGAEVVHPAGEQNVPALVLVVR